VRGEGVAGVVRRRFNCGEPAGLAADSGPGATSAGSTIVTSRGMRSCRRRSTARTIGTAWKRRGIGSPSTALARATRLIPWWWAMYERTTTERRPWGTRSGV
jgi:hypothetical protein